MKRLPGKATGATFLWGAEKVLVVPQGHPTWKHWLRAASHVVWPPHLWPVAQTGKWLWQLVEAIRERRQVHVVEMGQVCKEMV